MESKHKSNTKYIFEKIITQIGNTCINQAHKKKKPKHNQKTKIGNKCINKTHNQKT
jgi:hypothetical protein